MVQFVVKMGARPSVKADIRSSVDWSMDSMIGSPLLTTLFPVLESPEPDSPELDSPASEHATNDTTTSGKTAAKASLFTGIVTRLLPRASSSGPVR